MKAKFYDAFSVFSFLMSGFVCFEVAISVKDAEPGLSVMVGLCGFLSLYVSYSDLCDFSKEAEVRP